MEYIIDDDEAEQSEQVLKRSRPEPKFYSINRKYERQHRSRKIRLNSRDRYTPAKENIKALIFDSGGYSIKINYSYEEEAKTIPNSIMKAKSERKRLFIGDQIDECRDCSGLFYLLPCERGYITKWDVQKPIWDYIFSKNRFPPNDYPVIMTQPLFNFKSIQDCIDEIFFEEYEVTSLHRANPTDWAYMKFQEDYGTDTCVIVDSGYSFTHIVPYIAGKKYWPGVRRINIGGKLLTNRLKDMISYRQYHVMEETYVINQVKEDTCFVSQDFKSDLRAAGLSGRGNKIACNYVLPDFNNIRRGYIQNPDKFDEFEDNCQILRLNNERFSVPELLFHPSDVGMRSFGVAEGVHRVILNCPVNYQMALAKNIFLIGGSTMFPGFKKRMQSDMRSMICSRWDVDVKQPDDPATYSWQGGKSLLKSPNFKSKLVTKEQYEELGLSAIQERFNDWSSGVEEDETSEAEIEPISYINNVIQNRAFEANADDGLEDESENNSKEKVEEAAKDEIVVNKENGNETKAVVELKPKTIKKQLRSSIVCSYKLVSSNGSK